MMQGGSLDFADPSLPFGDINVLVLTDVHSWVGSHRRQEPFYNVDYGDILSFYENLKAHCDVMEMDLWFVSNGDWAHGTGLAGPGDAEGFLPLLEKMPWDALNCGNHELYESAKVESMIRPGGFVDWFGDRYLTANILRANDPDKKPLGNRYKVLQGKKSRLLTFGFLFNMNDSCDLVEIKPVQDVVKEKWFRDALLKESYDAIMILAHMDLVDPLVTTIRTAIRQIVGPEMPIQFITGHTHYRGSTQLDDASVSFEAGRFLDTIGFVSFPTRRTLMTMGDNTTESAFQGVFLDPNYDSLGNILKMTDFSTPKGKELSHFILKTQEKLGLLEEVGCAPQEYLVDVPLTNASSVFRLYRDQVVPKMFFAQVDTDNSKSIMLLPKDSFRYDLKAFSTLLVDDIWAVAPFNDTVTLLGSFSGGTILQLNSTLNGNQANGQNSSVPNFIMIGDIGETETQYKLFTHEFGSQTIASILKDIDPNSPVQPVATAYTSTLLWLSFVMENWPCSGSTGAFPGWFPTPGHVSSKLGRGNDDGAEPTLVLALIMTTLLAICATVMCCRFWIRYFVSREQHLVPHELLDSFTVKDLSLDEDKGSPRDSDYSDDLTDEDHEML